ncbi:hypothetical protein LNKW23_18730 [Paralimibaculum aggregatum]|uniref:Uncharacterized protein n=1 Tax=Paralimibaculum aggregatum TaxID=3036245 RepID=A0ABQ6LQ93_9RHOB|nr:hypothetical protein [Limibaculum sp. NKW23]GMG82660.1 hypothetical protein LNKW23_18730 [Limibaculum sp. NKW23]
MKSASQITLSKAWWKKEAPDGLKKSAPAFEKALEAFARADAALGKGRPDAEIDAFEGALSGLAGAGRQVAAEAKDLEKKAADRKAGAELANTVAVMGKPLAREIDAQRRKLEPLEDAVAAGDFGTPEAHKAFLAKWAPKIKRGTVSFAIGLPSNKPEEMRFNFHMSKDPRGLANPLKKHAGAKKFTFGRAGTLKLAAEVGEEDVGARTLCLHLEGRRIPGLAKRIRLMLKKLGFSQFGRVKVLEGGTELDAADEDTPDDIALDAVDLDAPDDGPDAAAAGDPAPVQGAPGPPPPGPAPPPEPKQQAPKQPAPGEDPAEELPPGPPRERLVAIQPRYAAAYARLKAIMPELRPEEATMLKATLVRYGQTVRSREPADALKIIRALEGFAAGNTADLGDLAMPGGPAPGLIRVRIKASPVPRF